MCSIIGALLHNLTTDENVDNANHMLACITRTAMERGRDGFGYLIYSEGRAETFKQVGRDHGANAPQVSKQQAGVSVRVIGNSRAEPTTEWVLAKTEDDQQPYISGKWAIVHNGTIANDLELRSVISPGDKVRTSIDSAAIVETLAHYEHFGSRAYYDKFAKTVKLLKGSYAIIAANSNDDNSVYIACNYRPIWMLETNEGIYFGSSRRSFGTNQHPKMISPYTINEITFSNALCEIVHHAEPMLRLPNNRQPRALVVCSGGLDSVVSAAYVQSQMGLEVELIHFQYGSRATGPELTAIEAVAKHMEVKLHVRQIPAYDPQDSNLLNPDSEIAGGEAGAEFAHEWVPARNLLLLATATAFAEAKGFDFLVLGNNLEEAGAYPDNEPEFIDRFQDLLRYAVGDGKFLDILQPVGNMMKHEIVKLGHDIEAPMHLTWSCYRAGKLHCGTCGPCFMRRTAFEINGLDEVIAYKD